MGSACDVEQTTFSVGLWRRIRHDYDILHVQEHRIGLPLQYLRAKGLSKPKVILGNGTGEPADVLRKFQYLQQLSPEYTEAWEAQKTPSQSVFTIPNFIDASQFVPGDRAGARRSLNLPEDRLIFLCVSAIRATHKRIDCLLKEFAEFAKQSTASPLLVIAGATDPDSAALIEYGKSLLGDNVVFLANVPRSNMQLLYQAADVFVISSLFEMFGIAIVEAMASGIPVICNDTATFRWVVGPAGLTADISGDGGLSRLFAAVADRNVRGSLAAQARSHVLANFSVEAVVPEMLKMYSSVASSI
jgi:glycosyltransferase involved in cell wall biosynthesis